MMMSWYPTVPPGFSDLLICHQHLQVRTLQREVSTSSTWDGGSKMFEISNLCLTHDVHDIQNKMEKRVKLQQFRNS